MASAAHESADNRAIPNASEQLRPQIQVLNVEPPKQRFDVANDIFGPTVATWRSNLAALSQRRNLLFMAYGCDIYVWVPKGPHQLLGSQPEMIITPVMKEPRAQGYIDRSNPHIINNILVDDLGLDEVLLLVTDSGNICGYHVEAIFSALDRCAQGGYMRPFNGAEVNPFFVEWVERSAWGLATHKFARLIAVSCNTGKVTVFAFALVDSASRDDGSSQFSSALQSEQSGQTWVPVDTRAQLKELRKLMPDNHRSRNLRLTYSGHFENIPCVSFANFDLDPNGLWMVSIDINNKSIVWRIWDDLWPIRWYLPGDPLNNPPERGWSVIPLDPRTFRRHETAEQACGCELIQEELASRTILNVTESARGVPDSSRVYISGGDEQERPEPIFLPDDILSPDCCVSDQATVHSSFVNDENAPDSSAPQAESHPRIPSVGSYIGDSQFSSSQVHYAEDTNSDLFHEDNEHLRLSPILAPSHHSDDYPDVVQDMGLLERQRVHPMDPKFFPVIHFSEHHISLAPYPVDSNVHMICRFPLHQNAYVGVSRVCDRFNMVKYLPDLGLVVAASQKGRVAIVSLTCHEHVGYAFRVDWIVPFYSQERNHERPLIPLLGMAVSPMPGFEIPPDVPVIPQDVEPGDGLKFKYRILNPDATKGSSPSVSSSSSSHASPGPPSPSSPDHPQTSNPAQHSPSAPRPRSGPAPSSPSHPNRNSLNLESDSPFEPRTTFSSHDDPNPTESDSRDPTLPELHARASLVYHPHERWHGWHPSRHYRLLLLFCDHTVMSYEFWHDWNS